MKAWKKLTSIMLTLVLAMNLAIVTGGIEAKAMEDWGAFKVSVSTSKTVVAGKSASFDVSIKNISGEKLETGGIYLWRYPQGLPWGQLKSGSKVISDNTEKFGEGIVFKAGETKKYKWTGIVPKDWKKGKNHFTLVISDVSGKYFGQCDFKGIVKTSKPKIKGTSISKVTAGKKKAVVRWKKQTKSTTGYQIQYSTDKKFRKGDKTVTIKKNKTTSKTIIKLKSKKKYYVRIRTYKKAKYGKKYINEYSSWSKIKSVRIK